MLNLQKYKRIILDPSTLRFVIVGTCGFIVNAFVLFILHGKLSINLTIGQIIASECAILFNFVLHDNWTYRHSKDMGLVRRISEFHASSWVGAIVTLVILDLVVGFTGAPYMLALAVGGGVAMLWNYCWTRFVIWKPDSMPRD